VPAFLKKIVISWTVRNYGLCCRLCTLCTFLNCLFIYIFFSFFVCLFCLCKHKYDVSCLLWSIIISIYTRPHETWQSTESVSIMQVPQNLLTHVCHVVSFALSQKRKRKHFIWTNKHKWTVVFLKTPQHFSVWKTCFDLLKSSSVWS